MHYFFIKIVYWYKKKFYNTYYISATTKKPLDFDVAYKPNEKIRRHKIKINISVPIKGIYNTKVAN